MKDLVVSTVRISGSPSEMDAEADRIRALQSHWTPSDRAVEAFVMAVDGQRRG